MRLIPLAALLLMGCASTPRATCTFTATFTLTEDADALCRPLVGKRRDDGSFIKDTDDIRGCASSTHVISNGTRSNIEHEFWEHLVNKNCPEWR